MGHPPATHSTPGRAAVVPRRRDAHAGGCPSISARSKMDIRPWPQRPRSAPAETGANVPPRSVGWTIRSRTGTSRPCLALLTLISSPSSRSWRSPGCGPTSCAACRWRTAATASFRSARMWRTTAPRGADPQRPGQDYHSAGQGTRGRRLPDPRWCGVRTGALADAAAVRRLPGGGRSGQAAADHPRPSAMARREVPGRWAATRYGRHRGRCCPPSWRAVETRAHWGQRCACVEAVHLPRATLQQAWATRTVAQPSGAAPP